MNNPSNPSELRFTQCLQTVQHDDTMRKQTQATPQALPQQQHPTQHRKMLNHTDWPPYLYGNLLQLLFQATHY